MVIGSHSIVIQ